MSNPRPGISLPNSGSFPVAENLCRVVSNAWVNTEYRQLIVEAPAPALTAKPGQFFHLACPSVGADRPFLRRPMSVYQVDREAGRIHFLYKVQGAGTRGLASLTECDILDAMGPVGQGFRPPSTARHVLIAGRGVGLATLAPLARHMTFAGAAVTAILSARRADLIMSADAVRAAGAAVIAVHDEDGTSDMKHVESLIRRTHAGVPLDFMATCGSNRLLALLQRLGRELQIPGQVAVEQSMGCALGMCFACVKPFRKHPDSGELTYLRVCWEGPVFDLGVAVEW
jgi:dihydroorotate dehydrogenase electron transfer subunit